MPKRPFDGFAVDFDVGKDRITDPLSSHDVNQASETVQPLGQGLARDIVGGGRPMSWPALAKNHGTTNDEPEPRRQETIHDNDPRSFLIPQTIHPIRKGATLAGIGDRRA
jgi:hypothetical protein